MPRSHAQPFPITCPHCGLAFAGDVWLIVDAGERPDLMSKVWNGTLHDLSCPSCGKTAGSVAAPLLIYRPGTPMPLVFSPSPDAAQDEMPEQSAQLTGWLRRALGDGWRDEWMETGITTVLRMSLVSILDDIENEEQPEDPEETRRREAFIGALTALTDAATGADAVRVLDAHPALTGDGAAGATAFFDRLADLRRRGGNEPAARAAEEKLELLRIHMVAGRAAALAVAATADSTLSRALGELFAPDASRDPEKGVALCEEALEHLGRDRSPDLWALLHASLGSRLAALPAGDRAQNLERAIESDRLALTVYESEPGGTDWLTVMVNLANALQERLRGDRADNFEEALAVCQRLAALITREQQPADWARVMDVTGSVYADRIRGDRAENLERALEYHQQALEVLSAVQGSDGWMVSTHNLARAYAIRIHGDRAANLDRAIALYEDALSHLDANVPEQAQDWALAMDNLGAAYAARPTGDREENLERSIEAYERALTVRTRERHPYVWAWTMANLGASYAQRRRGDHAENLDQAIRRLEQALDVLTKDAAPVRWAGAEVNLGTAYAERTRGTPEDNARHAEAAFTAAMEVHRPESLPFEARQTAFKLGALRQAAGDWKGAYEALALSAQAAEALYRSAYVPASQQVEIQMNADLYDRLVATCVRLRADPAFARRALVHAEEGKSRTFLAQMGQGDFPPPADAPAEALVEEQMLLSDLRQVSQALGAAASAGDERRLGTQRAAIVERLEDTWTRIAAAGRMGAQYTALRRGHAPSWDDLRELARELGPETALVEFHLLDDEIAVFCLRDGMDAPVVIPAPVSRQALLERYLLGYEQEVLRSSWITAAGGRRHRWLELGEQLLTPLKPHLAGARLVYFIPHGWLHTVPLHALTVDDEPFIVHYAAAYAASAGVLTRVLETERSVEAAAPPLVMGFTPHDDPAERYLFVSEAQGVADQFLVAPLLGAAATGSAIRQHAPAARLVHLACHGSFDRDDPLASGVHLSDGLLAAREWMRLRLRAELLTLSACETGFSRVGRGDEIASLGRVLLSAGAVSTLLTLWEVYSETTKEWMLEFYGAAWDSAGQPRLPKALAFQQATLALRRRYPDPLHWAPFVLAGDWR